MAWNPAKVYNGILSSIIAPPPHATQEYNVIIANEQEEYVCFSGMWWVPQNKLAYMEPLGAEIMTGGGDGFYYKIGYEEGIHWLHFRKR